MCAAPWSLPPSIGQAATFQQSVEKSPTAGGDISINGWRYFQRPLNNSLFQDNLAFEGIAKIGYSLCKCKCFLFAFC